MNWNLTKAQYFWLSHINKYGDLLSTRPAHDADHMGRSDALDEILKSHPLRPDLVKKDFNGDLELTPAGHAALSKGEP